MGFVMFWMRSEYCEYMVFWGDAGFDNVVIVVSVGYIIAYHWRRV